MNSQAALLIMETHHSLIAEELAPYETIDAWPAGTVMFREGTPTGGIYFLHSGEVDLQFSGKPMMTAEAGQMLGLTSVMSSRPHESTATTRTDCITGFIEKERFLHLLDEKPALWLAVLRMISSNISACWDCMRSLAVAK